MSGTPGSAGSERSACGPRGAVAGLGEALLRAAFAELFARGRRRVGLGVDTENVTGALRLYERVGMRPIERNDNWSLEP